IGIKFIGPTSENIGTMGDKAKARDIMSRHGLPVLPGSEGEITSEQEAAEVAAKIGYPVIIKASAGGGGRGMRVVNKEDELAHAFEAARAEANAAFGNQSVYKERRFYFMEMNTRIQVEHPITEEVTGIDLVKEQIRIATGQPLSWKQQDVKMIGHSIECRINAECPDTFTPCAGLITRCHPPG